MAPVSEVMTSPLVVASGTEDETAAIVAKEQTRENRDRR